MKYAMFTIGFLAQWAALGSARAANTLSECEKAWGFSLLFDGKVESFRSNFVRYDKNDSASNNPIDATWKVNAADSPL